jgi:hypothetical protein
VKPISFAEALRDVRLLGASFRGPSWRPWHVLAKIISGQPLDDSEMALVFECTGRRVLPKNPPRRLYLLVGRRGGKSRFLSALAVWVAALAANWRNLMAPGEPAVVMLVACDKKQAAVLRRYADGLLQAPLLAPEVVRRTEERIELRSGAVLEITTNDHRLIRGRSAIAVLGDEVSFWRADGESASSDEEVITAARPSLMTAPGGGYLVLSSTTYRKKGVMWDRYRELYGRNDASDLVWLAPSLVMNSSLPAAEAEAEIARDPVKNKAEYLSTWRDDISGFIPDDVLTRATDQGVTVRPWSATWSDSYGAFVDSAPGASEGNDSYCLAVVRGQPDGRVELCHLVEFVPPFDPALATAACVEILRSYQLNTVWGDRHGWVHPEFRRHGITYLAARPKSELYLACLPLLLSGRLRLLDLPKLRSQFASLERSVRAGGHEKIEEPLRSHDDLANVVAGAAVIMSEKLATGAAQIVSGDQFMGTFFAPRVVPDIPGGNAMPEDLAYAHLMASMRRRNGSDGSGGSNPNDRGLCW